MTYCLGAFPPDEDCRFLINNLNGLFISYCRGKSKNDRQEGGLTDPNNWWFTKGPRILGTSCLDDGTIKNQMPTKVKKSAPRKERQ